MNKASKQISMGALVTAGHAQNEGSGYPGASFVTGHAK